jgi:hypothetical protein
MYHPVKRFKIKQIVIFARIYTVKMAKLSVLDEDLAVKAKSPLKPFQWGF